MNEQALEKMEAPREIALDGCSDIKEAAKAQLALNNFIASQMKEGVDFGLIPGTKKKSCWQPGGQKLLYFNGLGVKMECTEKVQDWDKGFFHYSYMARAFHKRSGKVVAECEGSANSKEDRYAWRWVPEKKVPRGTNTEDLKQKEGPYGTLFRIENPDKFTLPNTLQKQSQKRAMVGVALLACRASENFTADYEEEDSLEKRGIKDAKDVTPPKGNEPPPEKKPSAPSDGLISDPQRKRLFAMTKAANIDAEELKQFFVAHYSYIVDAAGDPHTSKIKWQDYKAICAWVEQKGSGKS